MVSTKEIQLITCTEVRGSQSIVVTYDEITTDSTGCLCIYCTPLMLRHASVTHVTPMRAESSRDMCSSSSRVRTSRQITVQLSDYTRVEWFPHLGPFIEHKNACDAHCVDVTVANGLGIFSEFYCPDS